MRHLTPALLAFVLACGALPSVALAQGFNLASDSGSEIQVYADDGIEWVSDANRVIARRNAKATRGNVTLVADTLTAYYRQGANGNEIWRIDADGAVTISTPTETATGTKATYDLDKAVFVLRGQPAKLVTATDTVTAKDTLEYWEGQDMAVARGDAFASSGDRNIRADVLSAHFRDKDAAPSGARRTTKVKSGSGNSSLELQRADAYGHVVLTTAKEKVTGDRGDYNLETGIATVTGSVKLTRDGNELNGGYAHVNLNTGISKLFGAAPGGKDGESRAYGTFTPEKKDTEKRRVLFQGPGPAQSGGAGMSESDGANGEAGAVQGVGRR